MGDNTTTPDNLHIAGTETTRKRARAARACEFCRAKKYRCDELDPCSKCTKWNVQCNYQDASSVRKRLASKHPLGTTSDPETTSTAPADVEIAQRQTDGQSTTHTYSEQAGTRLCASPTFNPAGEVSEVNPHTLDTEFYGPTSSLAFLAAIQQRAPETLSKSRNRSPLEAEPSLVSAFHNDGFSPEAQILRQAVDRDLWAENYYFRQAQGFLDGYFQNLHYIHPFIDRAEFLTRCEDLWFGRSERQSRSFVALYYAILSLGALTKEWDEDLLCEMDRFKWSRKLFQYATLAMGVPPGRNDLETVQTYIIMAKVCQNELNPHLAYMYLGMAIRTALSAGHNRSVQRAGSAPQSIKDSAVSRTWWGLYSLEIETSFALGRPDSLGMDIYHNRPMPPVDDSVTAVLGIMVDFARIIRKVSISVYISTNSILDKVASASTIMDELDSWLASLPSTIRPHTDNCVGRKIDITKEPKWATKQRHTLRFRYWNVTMILYRPFLLHVASGASTSQYDLENAVGRCVGAARDTIELMHYMYRNSSYFRTWWYNTTYTLYAASVIVCYLTRIAPGSEKQHLMELVEMSIGVLMAMEESVVAKRAATLLKRVSTQVQEKDKGTETSQHNVSTERTNFVRLGDAYASNDVLDLLSPGEAFPDLSREIGFDFMAHLFPMDDGEMTFWTG